VVHKFKHLGDGDLPFARALLALFGEAFGEADTYAHPPETRKDHDVQTTSSLFSRSRPSGMSGQG
jgi:hypothetical protein